MAKEDGVQGLLAGTGTPSTMWILGTELRSPGLATNTLFPLSKPSCQPFIILLN